MSIALPRRSGREELAFPAPLLYLPRYVVFHCATAASEAAALAAGYETTPMGPLGLSAAPADGRVPKANANNTRIEARRDGAVI